MKIRKSILALLFLFNFNSFARADDKPLDRAHAHNDYNHQRPLFDALNHRFCSIEADIYLTNGQLLVAHDLKDVQPDRSLEKLYLKPLLEQVRKNGGRVYRDGPPVILLIDVKSDAPTTYAVLRDVLKNYAGMLTKFDHDTIQTNAVMVVVTGNRATEIIAKEEVRYAACDGGIDDLEPEKPSALFPQISAEWRKYFQWKGIGPIPVEDKNRLREIVEKTHRQGRRLRFWGTPDKPEFWRELFDAQVDLIGADDLDKLEKFLRSSP
jgi:hypothetical protein